MRKDHSLIALYHLVRSADALLGGSGSEVSEEILSIMEEAGYDQHPAELGKVAVLDGTYLAATDPTVIPESRDPLNTLWGVMAFNSEASKDTTSLAKPPGRHRSRGKAA